MTARSGPASRASGDARQLARSWARRVRANRRQVEAIRRGPESDDFYAPVSAVFVVDPHRRDDPTLNALLRMASPDETWLDIGAGAGRYALPLALAIREVVAVEPSPAMIVGLRDGMASHGITNLRVIADRWPFALQPAPRMRVDVALIAHVGYDIERIGPFLDAMEEAARRRCVAVLTDRSPASGAAPFWRAIHGQERVPLPALGELLQLLRSRGATPDLQLLPYGGRSFDSTEELLTYLRHQLWLPEGDEADERLRAEVALRASTGPNGLTVPDGPTQVGIVSWEPRH